MTQQVKVGARVNSLSELLALVRELSRQHKSFDVQCCAGDGRHSPQQYWIVTTVESA